MLLRVLTAQFFTMIVWLRPHQAIPLPGFEIIFVAESGFEESGSIALTCRDSWTADELNVHNVNFWLNRTLENNTDLRERRDIGIKEVGCCSIKFNLLRNLEGRYSCGKMYDNGYVEESAPLKLICKCNQHICFSI